MLYRPDIDGLRCLAVLGVLFTHLQIPLFEGGFTGVDVFFVISGYLITALLKSEIDTTGRVDFGRFYWRRARRLLPALVVTSLLVVVAGAILQSPDHYASSVYSVVAALFSVSNLLFWTQVGYFDTAADLKPMLHTWSLGVEEQFYLLWPLSVLMLMGFFGRANMLRIIAILGLMSFALNAAFLQFNLGTQIANLSYRLEIFGDGSSAAFYLLPFRIFEFCAGAALVFLPQTGKIEAFKRRYALPLSCFGIFLILLSYFDLDKGLVFPYYNALFPVIGSAVLIFSMDGSRLFQTLIGHSSLVFIGKISYYLYLIHWPLIVFYRMATGNELNASEQFGLAIISILLGYALHQMVERPIRYSKRLSQPATSKQDIAIQSMIPLSLIAVSVLGLLAMQIPNRVPPERLIMNAESDFQVLRTEYCGDQIPGYPPELFRCARNVNSDKTIVVWGDSHARHLAPGLVEAFPTHNVAVAFAIGCKSFSGTADFIWEFNNARQTLDCVARNAAILDWARQTEEKPAIWLLSNNNPGTIEDNRDRLLQAQLDALSDLGHNAYVIGDFIAPRRDLVQCTSVPDLLLSDGWLLKVCGPDKNAVNAQLRTEATLSEAINDYIPVVEAQCPQLECQFYNSDGVVLFRDDHHLSVDGSILFVGRLTNAIRTAMNSGAQSVEASKTGKSEIAP